MSDIPHKLIIFCAPSGSGKTTIAKEVMKRMPELSFSVSATNRDRRPHEVDGVDYWFLTTDEFKKRVAEGDFIEWEEVYPGRFYGTLKSEIQKLVDGGKTPVFDIEFKGATNIKKMYGDHALVIFVKAPMEVVKERLINRQTETAETLEVRMDRWKEEMEYESHADVSVENIDLERAVTDAINVISSFLNI
jgi:guanylate kinase